MEQTQALTLVDMFQYQGNPMRHVLIDDEPWWVAADICTILNIANVSKAVDKLDEDECITLTLGEGIRGNPNKNYVNEPGLYSLILRSDKPEAKAFKRWVTHEVLPAIRKTGSYSLQGLGSIEYLDAMIVRQKEIIGGFRKIRRLRMKQLGLPIQYRIPAPGSQPIDLREAVIHYIRRFGVAQPPTVRDLSRYITRSTTDEIRSKVLDLVQEGILYEDTSGKSPRYSLL